jgi:hypothetical protein
VAADNGKELVLHVKPKAEDGAKECKVLLEAAQAAGSPAVLGTLKDKHEGEWRLLPAAVIPGACCPLVGCCNELAAASDGLHPPAGGVGQLAARACRWLPGSAG